VVRDRPREEHLAIAPDVRLVVVQHELAEQAPSADERDEGERRDALLAYSALELGPEAGCGDVVDEHRLRILRSRGPRRVALRGGAIAVGKTAPGAEAEDAVAAVEQHRGALGAGGGEERVERGGQHLVERSRARDGVREAVDGVEVAQPRTQLLAFPDVTGGSQHVAKLAVLVTDAAPVDLEAHVAAGCAAHADGHPVDVLAGGDSIPGLRRTAGVVGMDQLEHLDAGEPGGIPAERGPGRRGVQHPALQVGERDQVVCALGDEAPQGVTEPVLGVELDVVGSAAQVVPPPAGRRSVPDRRRFGQRAGRFPPQCRRAVYMVARQVDCGGLT
jgi:hypothetical protein